MLRFIHEYILYRKIRTKTIGQSCKIYIKSEKGHLMKTESLKRSHSVVDDTEENKFTFTTNGGNMITEGGEFQYFAGQRPSESDVSGSG